MERLEKGRTAKGFSTGADSAANFRLVSNPDLPHLNPKPVGLHELPNELAIVDPVFGSVIDREFTPVIAQLPANEFHRERKRGGAIADELEDLLFPLKLVSMALQVGLIGQPDEPLGVLDLASLGDDRMEGRHLGVVKRAVVGSFDDQP